MNIATGESMKTFFETREDSIANRKWVLIDASDKVVGRLATEIARVLRGKDNPRYTPHNDSGDYVVVVNAEKVRFTGNKGETKRYFRHTGYVGGIKEDVAGDLLQKKPEEVIRLAVQGMLPKNPLGRSAIKKLKIYRGAEHPHAAQLG